MTIRAIPIDERGGQGDRMEARRFFRAADRQRDDDAIVHARQLSVADEGGAVDEEDTVEGRGGARVDDRHRERGQGDDGESEAAPRHAGCSGIVGQSRHRGASAHGPVHRVTSVP
jgi:hypothetical protein